MEVDGDNSVGSVQNDKKKITPVGSSRIYTGYRALGYIANHVPLVVRFITRRKENLIVTAIGKSFHTYSSSHLNLLSVGTPHEADISCLSADTFHVYTGCGKIIRAWRRGTELSHTYTGHEHPVHLMLPFGPHLIAIDEGNIMKIWDIKSENIFLELPFGGNFKISAICHPSTYVNKVLLGSQQGTLQLWNLRTNQQVFTFPGWKSPVQVLEQSPALDVVGIGLASGSIYLHNIKYDEVVMHLHQDWGPVLGLSFRTDGVPALLSTSPQGHIAVWDLEHRRLGSQIREAHAGAVTGLKCLTDEPVAVTSGPDNSLKMWIFDQSDGSGRLLRLREGHHAPPTCIRFHGNAGDTLLSAGQDATLRSFSTVTDRLNHSLGRAKSNPNQKKKKNMTLLPSVTTFSSEWVREKDWAGIVSCHRGLARTFTWRTSGGMGEHSLQHPRFSSHPNFKRATATCVCISVCGHFVTVGYSTGHVDRYNLQSGLLRATYSQAHLSEPDLQVIGMAGAITGVEGRAHPQAVRGLASDGLNQILITAGNESKLLFWKFKTAEELGQTDLPASPTHLSLHRESGLAAVVLNDWSVVLVELFNRNIVRRLHGHKGSVTDITFSPDARWLASAALDGTLMTWDLPTGACVDKIRLPSAVTSLSFSPVGNFLATSHVDDLGVYLWVNRAVYQPLVLGPVEEDAEAVTVPLPGTAVVHLEDGELKKEDIDLENEEFASPEQIANEFVTLSSLPASRWKNLLNLDLIKRRNKPVQPPQAPPPAPFFLGNLTHFNLNLNQPASNQGSTEPGSKLLSLGALQPLTPFASALGKAESTEKLVESLSMLKSLGPSGIDTELRGLSPLNGGSIDLMNNFLTAIQEGLKTKRDFEVLQAVLALFLKIHGSELILHDSCVESMKSLSNIEDSTWCPLQEHLDSNLALLTFLRHPVL